jgi:hypothetical protein
MTTSMNAPFLDVRRFEVEESETSPALPASAPWTPFLSVYEFNGSEQEFDDPMREAYASLVNELYDEEFDESLFELLSEARSLHDAHIANGHSTADADRIVTQHFAELTRESEAMLDAMAHEFSGREDTLDREMEEFVERYAPATTLQPSFEDFLGRLAKKALKGVSKVAKTIKNVALGPIFAQIKRILNPLLKQVMLRAIDRLPVSVRPAAHQLAQRLGFAKAPAATATAPSQPDAAAAAPAPSEPSATPTEPVAAATGTAQDVDTSAPSVEGGGSPVQADAGATVSEMQLEFDERLAQALLAQDEPELELELERAASGFGVDESSAFADLSRARERFAQDLENLKEGENPEPYIENFLPAVLPAVRLGIKIIGRDKVVNTLAGVLGKVVSKLIGPAQTPALSRAIVDAGLKLISLELSEEDETRLATSAIAATVEETLSRVTSLPEHVLEDETLLEGFALEAFEQAAAANLPAVFPEATYRRRPDLLEGGLDAAWVMLPIRGPRYKRCSRSFNVRITPQMAEAIDSFEDSRLSDYIQDQLGMPEGEDVETEVHLFETIAGSTAADVARIEGETLGMGSGDAVTVSQLQPLTPEAAELLLGRPGLGRRLPRGANVMTLPAGQRLYVLAGRRPVTVPGYAGRRRVRRLAHVYVTLDCPNDQMRVCVYLSEVKAQKLAVRLRQQAHAGSLAVAFTKLLARRLPPVLHGQRPRRLRIIHAGMPPGSAQAAALQQLQTVVPQAFITKVQESLVRAFSEFIKSGAESFLAAAEHPSDGVTVKFTIDHPPGMKELCASLAGKGAATTELVQSITKSAAPSVRVDALPGHKCD